MSRLPISMNRPNSARHERPMGIASPASAFKTTSTPRRSVSSMTASTKSPRRESITCFTPTVASIRRFTGVKRERLENIAEIQRRGFDIDHDFIRAALRRHERRKSQSIEMAAVARFQAQRNRRIELLLNRSTSAIDSLHITRLTAKSDFTLQLGAHQFGPKKVDVGRGNYERQIDGAADVVRILI